MDKTHLKSSALWMREEKNLESAPNPTIIGDFTQIAAICQNVHVDRIVVALDERRGKLPVEELLFCRLKGIRVDEGVTFTEHLGKKLSVENLCPSSLIFTDGFRRSKMVKKLKRWIDISFSLAGLILFLPITLLVVLAIKLDSRGPIFYKQERVGEDGKVFNLLKFRSMQVDAEKDGPVWAQVGDHRVTRTGGVIRQLHLDEIPQMINVLRGEMSFVGPRPERPFFIEKLKKEIPFYPYRHSVKPGITGWAQIFYPYGASKQDALEKLKYDLYYIKHMSPFMDLMIILETVKIVLFREGGR
jgi:sugar transferase (PEP-CTERM system associated)